MKDSPLYRFLKLGGGKINASLDSPTDTTYVQNTNHLLCNYQLRHEKGIFITGVASSTSFNEVMELYCVTGRAAKDVTVYCAKS